MSLPAMNQGNDHHCLEFPLLALVLCEPLGRHWRRAIFFGTLDILERR